MNFKINIQNENINISKSVLEAVEGDELLARLFINRGFTTKEEIIKMLDDNQYNPTVPEEFENMHVAVDLIYKAINLSQKICIYGDYDVDGVTSTTILVECLKEFTSNVIYHVPDRFSEGYGINKEVIRKLSKQNVDLIITCDCGISNHEEIKLAKSLGMEVIVTDHHNLPEVTPDVEVILNPKLLNENHRARNLPGCGMAYFLCAALFERAGKKQDSEKFLDMVGLSIIADVVSLTGENRYLFKKALPKIFNSKRPGLRALIEVSQKYGELSNEEDIAFSLAPRINAAGRMESARIPVELFLCKDSTTCLELARKMDTLNQDRKAIQQDMVEQAIDEIEKEKKNRSIIVLFNEYWHHGIIGIAAGRICELYKKPVILMSLKEDEKTVIGSARSVEGINIFEIIKKCSQNLIKFGGHSQAAGLSLLKEDVLVFIKEIEKYGESSLLVNEETYIDVDMEMDISNIDMDLYDKILSIGPFGEGFKAPLFLSRGISVLSDRKTDKNHHLMVVEGIDGTRIQAVKWFGDNLDLQGKILDTTYNICKNTYKGNEFIQLNLNYIKESTYVPRVFFKGRFVDERGIGVNEVLKKYEDVEVFYEGLEVRCPIKNTVNRFKIKQCNLLMFLSTPTNTDIFREVISLANPNTIIINFSITPNYSFKEFILDLMGIVKYCTKDSKYIGSLQDFAQKLCVEETLLVAGLKYLKALGKIGYNIDFETGNIYFESPGMAYEYGIKNCEKVLRNALCEKQAYKEFIMGLGIDNFSKYLVRDM